MFQIQNSGQQFASPTPNLDNISSLIEFHHVGKSVEKSLWSSIDRGIIGMVVLPLLVRALHFMMIVLVLVRMLIVMVMIVRHIL